MITGDNATTNDTLCQIVADFLKKDFRIKQDLDYQRLNCLGHIFNLAVHAFLFKDAIDYEALDLYEREEREGSVLLNAEEKSRIFRSQFGVLGKLHNIVVYSRSSPHHTKRLKEILGHSIPLDNRTRWNSWYQMLHIALKYEEKIYSYIKESQPKLEKD